MKGKYKSTNEKYKENRLIFWNMKEMHKRKLKKIEKFSKSCDDEEKDHYLRIKKTCDFLENYFATKLAVAKINLYVSENKSNLDKEHKNYFYNFIHMINEVDKSYDNPVTDLINIELKYFKLNSLKYIKESLKEIKETFSREASINDNLKKMISIREWFKDNGFNSRDIEIKIIILIAMNNIILKNNIDLKYIKNISNINSLNIFAEDLVCFMESDVFINLENKKYNKNEIINMLFFYFDKLI